MITRRIAVAAAGIAAALALTSCAHRTIQGPPTTRTVTVTPVAQPSNSAASSVTRSTEPIVVMRRLPGTCFDLLNVGTLIDTLGRRVPGKSDFVVGAADAATGRISYLNCRYGVGAAAPDGTIEIGVSLYRDATHAAARIAPTVSDFTDHSASVTSTTVAGLRASLLTGGQGAGYGNTIVLATGQRTIAVTAPTASSADLSKLAALAVRRTSAA